MSQNLYMSLGRDTSTQKRLVKVVQYNKKNMVIGYYNKVKIFDQTDILTDTFSLTADGSPTANAREVYAEALAMLKKYGVGSSANIVVTINGKNYSLGGDYGLLAPGDCPGLAQVKEGVWKVPSGVTLKAGDTIRARLYFILHDAFTYSPSLSGTKGSYSYAQPYVAGNFITTMKLGQTGTIGVTIRAKGAATGEYLLNKSISQPSQNVTSERTAVAHRAGNTGFDISWTASAKSTDELSITYRIAASSGYYDMKVAKPS